MSAELAPISTSLRRLRVDLRAPADDRLSRARIPILLALAALFVFLGGSGLDLGGDEARLGLAAGSSFGPLGKAYGGWEPGLWPLQVLPSRIWALFEGGLPSTGSVRWPAAIAAAIAGLIVCRRADSTLGPRGSILTAACLFGSLAMIDRTSSAGIDWISGLFIVAALDRLLATGPGWAMGGFAALAFLAGGLPPLAMAALPVIVLRKPGSLLGLIVPPLAALVAWSCWTLAAAPAQAWGAALTLPLVQGSAWTLGLGVAAFALPWTPVAALWGFRSIREATPGRSLISGWLQVAGVALISGTLIPGMAGVARLPIALGLAIASAGVLDRAWTGSLTKGPRRLILGIALATTLLWAILAVPAGCYIAAAIAYYRSVGVAIAVLAVGTFAVTATFARRGEARGAVFALFAVAVMLKAGHWGVYAPEWNYRFSQGPWGRAIGQWVPPKWTLFTTVSWPADFAFAIGRPLKRLSGPERLADELGRHAQLVLIHDAEFENWPKWAPKLTKLREFEDQYGGRRVLARTEGEFNLLRIGPGD